VGWFTDLFSKPECLACKVLREQVSSLKDEIGFLRGREVELTDLLAKATHIQVLTETRHVERNHTEPVGGARTWPQIRSKLEAMYKKSDKSPEDVKDEYWRNKIKEQEAQLPELSVKTEVEEFEKELRN
jgi:hypothetical protein